jgi:hypothetical protein
MGGRRTLQSKSFRINRFRFRLQQVCGMPFSKRGWNSFPSHPQNEHPEQNPERRPQ